MKYSHALLLNLLITTFSGVCVCIFFDEYMVLAAYHNRPYTGLLVTVTPYLLVYLGFSLIARFRAAWQLFKVLVVSIVGSLIVTGYVFTHFALTYLQKPGQPTLASFIGPTFLLLIYTVVVHLLISLKYSAFVGIFDRQFVVFKRNTQPG